VRRFGLVLVLGVGACDEGAGEQAAMQSVATPPSDAQLGAQPVDLPDDPFVYATGVTVLPAHAPTRFEARLPGRYGEFGQDGSVGALPSAYFEARLCAGDDAMRQRMLDALGEVAPFDAALFDPYVDLLMRCPSSEHCRWLADAARADHPAKFVLASSMTWCENPTVGDVLVSEYAPPRATINWLRNNTAPTGERVPPELERAVRRILDEQRDNAFTDATVALARYPGRAAASLIEELQTASNRIAVDTVDEFGYGGEAPDLITAACEYLLVAPQCAELPGYREIGDADVVIAGTPEQYEQALLVPKRAAKANDLLAACVRDPYEAEPRRAHCLARLAARDWASAKAVAAPLSSADPEFHEALRIVSEFESHAALRRQLADLGLIGDEVLPTYRESLSVANELVQARRLFMFPGQSGTVPVRHDALLFELAGLAGDAMADVVFEELPPTDIDEIYDTSPYVLRAYADGKRWSVVAEAVDDFYEIRQCIGLLNVVAAERGSDLRWVALRSDDLLAVLVGDKNGILTAAERRLIELADL
jgi:hypothetical protein